MAKATRSTKQSSKSTLTAAQTPQKDLSETPLHVEFFRCYSYLKHDFGISVDEIGLEATKERMRLACGGQPGDQPATKRHKTSGSQGQAKDQPATKRRKTSANISDGMMSPVSDSSQDDVIEVTPQMLQDYHKEWEGLNRAELQGLLGRCDIKFGSRLKEPGLLKVVGANGLKIAGMEEKRRRRSSQSITENYQTEDEMEIEIPQTSKNRDQDGPEDTLAIAEVDDEEFQELKKAAFKKCEKSNMKAICGLFIKYKINYPDGADRKGLLNILTENKEKIAKGEVMDRLREEVALRKLQENSKASGGSRRSSRR